MEPIKDFKLLAIRTRKGCDKQFLRILSDNEIYRFYHEYNFVKDGDEITSVTYTPSVPYDLYQINNSSPTISLSAIVGKNGSGKSTIVELLYVAIYNIAHLASVLPNTDDEGNENKFVSGLHLEIFYKKEGYYYKICLADSDITFSKYPVNGHQGFSKPKTINKKANLKEVFYSLVINYSHYSLNSRHVGEWANSVFHKNDGYQTPIVLNPFRIEGKIDINIEEYLTRSRLITNLLTFSDRKSNNFRTLLPGKTVESIVFKLNKKKAKFDKKDASIAQTLQRHRLEIANAIITIIGSSEPIKLPSNDDREINIAIDYIIKKAYTISVRYSPYHPYTKSFLTASKNKENKTEPFDFSILGFRQYLEYLSKDNSHITFKLRQAIYFIKNVTFYKRRIGKLQEIDELSKAFQKILPKKTEAIFYAPPSFLDFDIKFKKSGRLNSLSSGEKQKIFSSTTIAYHLLNLDSVDENTGYLKYSEVNLVLDEIELYYHPEMQRNFVNDFLLTISNLNLRAITAINCIFVTHSPFILSDIPQVNILFLEENGVPIDDNKKPKTFGANIHDILKQGFFLKDGSMGEYAKQTINNLIRSLNYYKQKKSIKTEADPKLRNAKQQELEAEFGENPEVLLPDGHLHLINLIDEPILSIKLKELYENIFDEKSELQRLDDKISELQKRKELLAKN